MDDEPSCLANLKATFAECIRPFSLPAHMVEDTSPNYAASYSSHTEDAKLFARMRDRIGEHQPRETDRPTES